MKKLMKKKINIFGKVVSVPLVILVATLALVSAAFIPYFATITGLVAVGQGLTWDGQEWDSAQLFSFDGESTTSLEEKTFTSPHYLENIASVEGEFALVTTCMEGGSPCDGVDGVDWYYDYMLTVLGGPGDGLEKRVAILASEAGISDLSDLDNISWGADVFAGYLPHVDVFLDNDEVLVFEYAKVNPAMCDGSTVPGDGIYPTGVLSTFKDKGMVNDLAYAWLSSGVPGPCGVTAFDDNHRSLADWKNEYPAAKILRFEVEVDSWIPTLPTPEAIVSSIKVNGVSVEVSRLEAGEKIDFNFNVHFPKMLVPGGYNITTEVLTA